MEALIVIAILLVIALILGVSTQALINASAWAILGLCAVMTLFMTVFFFVYSVKLLKCKKARGVFLRAEKREESRFKKFRSAVYDVGGEEYINVFPYDGDVLKSFYRENKETTLYIEQKSNHSYDLNARITIVFGFFISAIMTYVLIQTALLLYSAV